MHEQDRISEAARALAAQRKRVAGRCAMCGEAFTGTTKRRYCSGRCRVAAVRSRQAGSAAATRRGRAGKTSQGDEP